MRTPALSPSKKSELTAAEVQHVARLARLELTEGELEKLRLDLSAIVSYMERLGEVDTSRVPATLGVQPQANVFREDIAAESLGPDAVLANAPRREQNAFQIPRILEEA